jgi:hypothetical protein
MPETTSGTTGDRNLVRISASAVGDGGCLAFLSAKARPGQRPACRPRWRRPASDEFPLGAFMAAVDEVQFGRVSLTTALEGFGGKGKPLHPGAAQWGRHAVNAYMTWLASSAPGTAVPVRHFWVARRSDTGTTWEMYAWGRRYASPDGAVREVHLLRLGSVREAERDLPKEAVAAYSAAFGLPAAWPNSWDKPFQLVPDGTDPVRRVRVIEVGLADGSHAVRFDGTPREAETFYAEHARDRVRAIGHGGPQIPGFDCADCKLVTACEALRRIPGLLGITAPNAPLRTWSATSGRDYADCPAKEHLRRLHLPSENEYGPAAVRGHAVHGWLAENHAGPLRSACTVWDVPHPPDDWGSGRWHVTGRQARDGALMLAGHADLCPFHHGSQITEVRLEHTVAVHDTAANVIVIAQPDMLYLDDGAWAWRELKTRLRLPQRGPGLYREYPQLAVAVVLMAENALGGKPCGQRVELELLTPRASDIWLIDPTDQAEISQARAAVHELAAAWRADEAHAASPGPHCADCPVRRWCPDADTRAGA